jgi:hypothetical protein
MKLFCAAEVAGAEAGKSGLGGPKTGYNCRERLERLGMKKTDGWAVEETDWRSNTMNFFRAESQLVTARSGNIAENDENAKKKRGTHRS